MPLAASVSSDCGRGDVNTQLCGENSDKTVRLNGTLESDRADIRLALRLALMACEFEAAAVGAGHWVLDKLGAKRPEHHSPKCGHAGHGWTSLLSLDPVCLLKYSRVTQNVGNESAAFHTSPRRMNLR
jgi:hypothetical protein